MIVSPSLLGFPVSSFPELAKDLHLAGAEWIHLDVMDGKFVPRVTFFEEALIDLPESMEKDVHLMVEHPLELAPKFLEKGADTVTFHVEAVKEEEGLRLISLIHSYSAKAGISLRPGTPIEALKPYLPLIDLVLVMSVEPGKGGQAFLPSSCHRIAELAKLRESLGATYLIEVDGGINAQTGKEAASSGADVLVSGSYLVGQSDYAERLKGLLLC